MINTCTTIIKMRYETIRYDIQHGTDTLTYLPPNVWREHFSTDSSSVLLRFHPSPSPPKRTTEKTPPTPGMNPLQHAEPTTYIPTFARTCPRTQHHRTAVLQRPPSPTHLKAIPNAIDNLGPLGRWEERRGEERRATRRSRTAPPPLTTGAQRSRSSVK